MAYEERKFQVTSDEVSLVATHLCKSDCRVYPSLHGLDAAEEAVRGRVGRSVQQQDPLVRRLGADPGQLQGARRLAPGNERRVQAAGSLVQRDLKHAKVEQVRGKSLQTRRWSHLTIAVARGAEVDLDEKVGSAEPEGLEERAGEDPEEATE